MGIHKDDAKFEYYMSSSNDPHLLEAARRDNLDRVVLARGSKTEIYSQEYFYLSKFDAMNNPKFFNKNNGGGAGLDKNYRPDPIHEERVTKWVTENVWVDENKELLRKRKKIDSEPLRKLAKEIKDSIVIWKADGKGKHNVEEMPIQQIYILPRIQARAIKIIQDKLDEMTLAFRNIGLARKNITPVIVIIKDNNPIYLIDGNHRVEAAHRAGWNTFPVIKIDDSIFEDDEYNRNYFGNLMNHVAVERTGNNSDDLIMRLKELHDKYPEYDIDSNDFKEIAKDELGYKNVNEDGLWKNADVVRRCDKLATMNREQSARSQSNKNFHDYKKPRTLRLWALSEHFNYCPVIVQSLQGINNGGVGGVISYAVQNYINKGVNEANLIIHFPSLNDYISGEAAESVKKLRKTLEVGVKSKINIFFADPFEEQIVTNLPGL